MGGWPTPGPATPPKDTDLDGIPDAWEEKHGFRVGQADHNGDPYRDGYTNLEEFLNATDPRAAENTSQ